MPKLSSIGAGGAIRIAGFENYKATYGQVVLTYGYVGSNGVTSSSGTSVITSNGNGNYTFRPPKGVSKVSIVLVGGGGGGASGGYGGGGGGGSTTWCSNVPVDSNTNYTIQIGKGGSAGYIGSSSSGGGWTGFTGSASWFNTYTGYAGSTGSETYLSAKGGIGGVAIAPPTVNQYLFDLTTSLDFTSLYTIISVTTGTNILTLSYPANLVVGLKIIILGTAIGDLVAGTYYILSVTNALAINTSTTFTVSSTFMGPVFNVGASTVTGGTMTATVYSEKVSDIAYNSNLNSSLYNLYSDSDLSLGGYYGYDWVCPERVWSISVTCVGGGGSGGTYYSTSPTLIGASGGHGGNLAYRNYIAVIPGQTYRVHVGWAARLAVQWSSTGGYGGFAGGDSAFFDIVNIKVIATASDATNFGVLTLSFPSNCNIKSATQLSIGSYIVCQSSNSGNEGTGIAFSLTNGYYNSARYLITATTSTTVTVNRGPFTTIPSGKYPVPLSFNNVSGITTITAMSASVMAQGGAAGRSANASGESSLFIRRTGIIGTGGGQGGAGGYWSYGAASGGGGGAGGYLGSGGAGGNGGGSSTAEYGQRGYDAVSGSGGGAGGDSSMSITAGVPYSNVYSRIGAAAGGGVGLAANTIITGISGKGSGYSGNLVMPTTVPSIINFWGGEISYTGVAGMNGFTGSYWAGIRGLPDTTSSANISKSVQGTDAFAGNYVMTYAQTSYNGSPFYPTGLGVVYPYGAYGGGGGGSAPRGTYAPAPLGSYPLTAATGGKPGGGGVRIIVGHGIDRAFPNTAASDQTVVTGYMLGDVGHTFLGGGGGGAAGYGAAPTSPVVATGGNGGGASGTGASGGGAFTGTAPVAAAGYTSNAGGIGGTTKLVTTGYIGTATAYAAAAYSAAGNSYLTAYYTSGAGGAGGRNPYGGGGIGLRGRYISAKAGNIAMSTPVSPTVTNYGTTGIAWPTNLMTSGRPAGMIFSFTGSVWGDLTIGGTPINTIRGTTPRQYYGGAFPAGQYNCKLYATVADAIADTNALVIGGSTTYACTIYYGLNVNHNGVWTSYGAAQSSISSLASSSNNGGNGYNIFATSGTLVEGGYDGTASGYYGSSWAGFGIGSGGEYGGGGPGGGYGGAGGNGAVRIVWGPQRTYPDTNLDNLPRYPTS